jgi:hypothetical protein
MAAVASFAPVIGCSDDWANYILVEVSAPAILDSHSTRRPRHRAGQEEKTLSAEPKDRPKDEDRMQSNQIP